MDNSSTSPLLPWLNTQPLAGYCYFSCIRYHLCILQQDFFLPEVVSHRAGFNPAGVENEIQSGDAPSHTCLPFHFLLPPASFRGATFLEDVCFFSVCGARRKQQSRDRQAPILLLILLNRPIF